MTSSRNTNWVVLTGTSCSGKTTTGRLLAQQLGCRLIEEPVRLHIEEQIASGRPKAEIVDQLMSDRREYQKNALKMRVLLEDTLDPLEPLILDRGIPDSIGYFNLWGLNPAEAKYAASKYRYRVVAWFAPLSMVNDGIRLESEEQRAQLSALLLEAYLGEGYDVLKVPVGSLAERAEGIARVIHHILDGIRP